MHYEVELGLIMGKTVRDLDPADEKGALDAIEGLRTRRRVWDTISYEEEDCST